MMNRSYRALGSVWMLSASLLALVFMAIGAAGASSAAAGAQPAVAQSIPPHVWAAIAAQREQWRLSQQDVASLRLIDTVAGGHNGVTHFHLGQTFAGLDVFGAMLNMSMAADGRLLHSGNRLIPDLAARINSTTPHISPADALQAAARQLSLPWPAALTLQNAPGGAQQEVIFRSAALSHEPIHVKLIYQPVAGGALRLAWNIEIDVRGQDHYWSVRIDAIDGSLLHKSDYVAHDYWPAAGAQATAESGRAIAAPPAAGLDPLTAPRQTTDGAAYLVFAIPKEYPHDGPRTLEVDPAHPLASPYGWHDLDGVPGAEITVTRGNNVHAYTDVNADNLPDPGSEAGGGATLVFSHTLDLSQEPAAYRDAAVTNLFYWTNILHDVFYLYGFDEQAGNFQMNNYGRGGLGNDALRAEAQDGANTNSANFTGPPDGGAPRLQMFLWDMTTPGRDGSLSSLIIAHEYGHGVSFRLVGGPSLSTCLSNREQMGEGWSDFFGLALTAQSGDVGTMPRGVATYVMGQDPGGPGIRATPYSTDFAINPTTYDDVKDLAAPHGVGYAWAAMLWDVYWALVEAHGFNPDIYEPWHSAGNNLALQLVMDGMKFLPCHPGFVDGRDAILAADLALTGGENECRLWQAFARRGLGYSAEQGSSNNTTDGIAAYDLAPQCKVVWVQPEAQNMCANMAATYEVLIGAGFAPPIALAVEQAPPGASSHFGQNPLSAAPFTTTLQIGSAAAAPAGSYTVTVSAVDSVSSHTADAVLHITRDLPDRTTLIAPEDGLMHAPFYPSFEWQTTPGAERYLLEVASDSSFESILLSVTLSDTHHTMSSMPAPGDLYWRVTSLNVCGAAKPSAARRLTIAVPRSALFLPVIAVP